jgi:hypothetical protein
MFSMFARRWMRFLSASRFQPMDKVLTLCSQDFLYDMNAARSSVAGAAPRMMGMATEHARAKAERDAT